MLSSRFSKTICNNLIINSNIYKSSITNNLINLNSLNFTQIRTATKKAGGTVKNGRDSIGKRLGLKKVGGQRVIPGNIIIRQRGLSYASGDQTGLGRDYTIYSLATGYVKFTYDFKKKRQIVSIVDHYPYKTSPEIIEKQKLEKEQRLRAADVNSASSNSK